MPHTYKTTFGSCGTEAQESGGRVVGYVAPGPFRSSQLREGDPYELSEGHAIRCMTAGARHGRAHSAGDRALATDPAVAGEVGVDVGITWGEDKNLRAPDLIVGGVQSEPGWQRVFPPLAVEYADAGQDEDELQRKIAELLAGGTRLIWVVRLVGPLRVEEYAAGRPVRVVHADESLTAPGILQNPVPVRALVDPQAANEVALRNLLQARGYASIEEIEDRGKLEGELTASRAAIRTVLAARGLSLGSADEARLEGCSDLEALRGQLGRAAVAADASELFNA